MQKALDTLATKKNVRLQVHIIDLDSDTMAARATLNKPPFPDVDVIIGPVFNNNLRVFSRYARERKIPVISPSPPPLLSQRTIPITFPQMPHPEPISTLS